MIDLLVAVCVVLFVASQSLYFVINVVVDLLLYPRPTNLVTEADPDRRPRVNVMLPVYDEPRSVVQGTIEHVSSLAYPSELVDIHLVYEPDDDTVTGYVDELQADAVLDGFGFEAIPVDHETLRWNENFGEWGAGGDLPRTKAAALNYAFYTGTFHPDSVVTVFDSDTRVADDLFDLAVTGLEEYDVVQAKQTVRNLDDGWLPRLEAMGMAAWTHVVYPRTSEGPYQLLGKAYFMRTRDLYALDAWDSEAVTEDMALGIEAHGAGYSLGVLDRYVQDLCPADPGAWVSQKKRWMTGPYRVLLSPALSTVERVRFATFTLSNQMVSVANLVGVPAGLAALGLQLTVGIQLPLAVSLIVLVNLVNWAYYSVRTYEAATDAIPFESRGERLWYYVVSNPLTQAVYASVWTIPILAAVWDWTTERQVNFEVTRKRADPPTEDDDEEDPFAALRPDDAPSDGSDLGEGSPAEEGDPAEATPDR